MSSVLRGEPQVVELDGPRAVTVFPVAADEPVFAGHYPGFPILPGVCLVECAYRSALATAPDGAGALHLAEVRSARFSSPVLPGDQLTTIVTWRSGGGGEWWCDTALATARAPSARIRLRLVERGSDDHH